MIVYRDAPDTAARPRGEHAGQRQSDIAAIDDAGIADGEIAGRLGCVYLAVLDPSAGLLELAELLVRMGRRTVGRQPGSPPSQLLSTILAASTRCSTQPTSSCSNATRRRWASST